MLFRSSFQRYEITPANVIEVRAAVHALTETRSRSAVQAASTAVALRDTTTRTTAADVAADAIALNSNARPSFCHMLLRRRMSAVSLRRLCTVKENDYRNKFGSNTKKKNFAIYSDITNVVQMWKTSFALKSGGGATNAVSFEKPAVGIFKKLFRGKISNTVVKAAATTSSF